MNVLFVTFASENFDGATYSLMDLIKSVRPHVHPIVMVRTEGCVYDYFVDNDVECFVCDFKEDLVGKPVKFHQHLRYIFKYIPKRIEYHFKNVKCVNTVSKALKGRNIDIVHSNNAVSPIGYELAKSLNAKFVWHLRGFLDLDFGCIPLRGWPKYRETLQHADAVVGVTQAVLEHHMPAGGMNSQVISDAVRSQEDACLVIPKEKYFLFVAGLLTEQKGCGFAIEAFAQSGLAEDGYQLKIIGDASPGYKLRLSKIVSNSGLSGAVEFLGKTHQVKEYMARATAFLMCSENEGMGRVSVEAMFYGCLVIGRNSGGTKNFLDDGQTGLLFSDLNSCVSAMIQSTETDHLHIIRNAHKLAKENFSIEVYGAKILRVYNEVLNQSLV